MQQQTTTMQRIQWAASLARRATFLCLVVMFIGTHLPGNAAPSVQYHDKLIHFLAYTTLTFGILASWELSTGPLLPIHYFVVWLAATLYAAIDEITQIPVGRTCDGLDWLCDVLGIVVGLTLFRCLRPLIYRFLLRGDASTPTL
ncbi:VanZ family protein [Bythopirellula goksoeyrii]|uniref:VanZ like family protein n=1 Tax=Bythopirellula goksoeyrii TaxID=1400387 RepID=A0A5B9Q7R5_9BACT|nr:VanZ family protein [Bythopirellula goksoeyrii]QEG33615.1 VanZ like family protein [Bythopirellula goksoeyrii]